MLTPLYENPYSPLSRFQFEVKALQANAQSEYPLPQLVDAIIEAATLHAEGWGIGYATLIEENHSWVLARLALELTHYPKINETVIIESWVESFNKHFSARNFAISNPQGEVYGYVRTIWSIIDLASRSSVDVTTLPNIEKRPLERECPIAPQSKMRPLTSENPTIYSVRYSDIDLNRHVDSIRYIEHLLDTFPMEKFDTHRVARFEINYMDEALYGMQLALHKAEQDEEHYQLEIKEATAERPLCRSKITFAPREAKNKQENRNN